jgi:putative transcriptional regulator
MSNLRLRQVAATFLFSVALLTGGVASAVGLSRPVPRHLAGHLLVATRAMHDPHFMHAVIFIVRDKSQGTMGIVINRVMGKVPFANLLKDTGADPKGARGQLTVHYGGPLEPAIGILLHSSYYRDKNTMRIDQHYAITGGTKVLKAIAAGKGPRRSLFALGYAGWGPGQLQREIREGAWIVIKASDDIVFSKHPATVWQRAIHKRTYKI